MSAGDLLIPAVVCGIAVYGLARGVPVFDCFQRGAAKGLAVVYKITPAMIGIMLLLGMLRGSGALELMTELMRPVTEAAGIPGELSPLMLLRPISGSGALAVFKDIIAVHGPDSHIGRVASVMQGSTETTFYTIAIYYGVTRVKKTRHTLAAAAAGDLTGFVMSAVAVALFLGGD